MDQYTVRITLAEDMLGTVAMNKELYGDYIATKAPQVENGDEELATVEELTEKGTTGFHRLAGKPILYDYVLKGFFKSACGFMRDVKGSESGKLKNYKKRIDGLVFVTPRRITITLGGAMGINERPLRAHTAQGERVALARSETVPAGSCIEFTIRVLGGPITEELLREWLDYGANMGLGQWRSGGWGAFTYEMTK